MKKYFFFTLIFVFLWSLPIWAADYYVRPHDTDAACTYGSCDGTSYADAWEGFAGGDGTPINWTTVDAGNGKLFVCGTHLGEKLIVGQSGEDGTPIYIASCTIANGASADDPGIIDANNAVDQGVRIDTKSYITVDGLTITNMTTIGAGLRVATSSNIIAKNLSITSQRTRGIQVTFSSDVLIQDCTVDVGSIGGSESDSVYIAGAGGTDNVMDGCTVYQRNGDANHNDAIQIHNQTDFILKNNYIENVGGADNDQTAMIEDQKSTFTAYNNVFINNATGNHVLLWDNGAAWTADIYFWNNTFYNPKTADGRALSMNIPAGDVKEIQNNIFIADDYGLYFNNAVTDKTGIIHNCYYITGSYVGHDSGGDKTWAQWQTAGYESSGGLNEDPLLDGNYKPYANSPVIDAGEDLGAHFTTDYDGSSQYDDGRWDIGAYRFKKAGGE